MTKSSQSPPPTAAVPPDTTGQVITTEGEEPTLPCPLQTVERFNQFYRVEWRVPVNRTIARSNSGVIVPWARLNDFTLELTVDISNITTNHGFHCALVSFNRRNHIPFSSTPRGNVDIITPCKFYRN